MEVEKITKRLKRGYQFLQSQSNPSEADTYDKLIRPVIRYLGYKEENISREKQDNRQRPDALLFEKNQEINKSDYANVILEFKRISIDLDSPTQIGDRTTSPENQRRRYLREHSAAGDETAGVATNGLEYRTSFKKEIHNVQIIKIFSENGEVLEEALKQLKNLIGKGVRPEQHRAETSKKFIELLNAIAEGSSAKEVSENASINLEQPRQGELALEPEPESAKLRSMLEDECEEIHIAKGPEIKLGKEEQLFLDQSHINTAFMRLKWSSNGIGRADAAQCALVAASARIRDGSMGSSISVCFIWQSKAGEASEARIAVATPDKVSMTDSFDSQMPGATVIESGSKIIQLLNQKSTTKEQLHEALDIRPLQQSFYSEIRGWFRACRNNPECVDSEFEANESDQALLRHLIRCIFVWMLNSNQPIDDGMFDSDSITRHKIKNFHNDVMRYIFRDRLNTEHHERKKHSNPILKDKFKAIPYLNGSLFAEHTTDDAVTLRNEDYRSANQRDGLLDILERYHWTIDEQHPLEREQTLDPELLSNLFEQLASDRQLEENEKAEGSKNTKAPDGTYYTPTEVATEMAADALAETIRLLIPQTVPEEEVLDLFRNPRADLKNLLGKQGLYDKDQRCRVIDKLKRITIFDPCTGSGEFLLAILRSLKTALYRLGEKSGPLLVRHIIINQLYGLDINPLATQITRLRLYIAIEASERGITQNREVKPLPNLETQVICADTLRTQVTDQYDPLHPEYKTIEKKNLRLLEDSALRKPIEKKINEIAKLRISWKEAYSLKEKEELVKEDKNKRKELEKILSKNSSLLELTAKQELESFCKFEALRPSGDAPTKLDARILLGRIGRENQGFDIVIGNPPYGQKRFTEEEKKELINRGYQTLNANDTYTLFCETAISLALQESGIVSLIIPLNICFGKESKKLREIIEKKCQSVTTRSYDNIPDTIFNAHPLFKTWKNKARCTIIKAERGKGKTTIRTGPIYRWSTHNRYLMLHKRPLPLQTSQTQHKERWATTPNQEIQNLIQQIYKQSNPLSRLLTNNKNETPQTHEIAIALPNSAWYFISALPYGRVKPRLEKIRKVKTQQDLHILMTVLNNHISYGWYRTIGDALNIKWTDFEDLAIPKSWMSGKNRQKAVALGKKLERAIPKCIVSKRNANKIWRNVNFFTNATQLIRDIDIFYLNSLGITQTAKVNKTLETLEKMRSRDSWDFE